VRVRLRIPILVKLLVALVLPAVALFAVFGWVAYQVERHDLDDELGRRLEAIAASTATTIHNADDLLQLSPGDEDGLMYQTQTKRLASIAAATGVHVFVVDKQLGWRADSSPGVAIGTHYNRAELDRVELDRVFARGQLASSITFEGNDGTIYKTGYAPVRASATDAQTALAVGVQAPASYFDQLDELESRLMRWGAALAAISLIAVVIATLLITRNIRVLAAAAERIGGGDLRAKVEVGSRDELGVLGDAMDRMRAQLAERDARMQQMLAGIAHEVRNPLAGMTLFAGILGDEIEAGDERRGHVDKIKRELGYLERVVNDFLEYARRPKPELGDVEVGELLAEVAQMASTPAVTATADDTKLVARADRGQLRRAMLNLARNAVQAATAAGADGDAVALRAAKADGELRLTVWNRGKEIPPETSAKLFEPFFTTREKGTGLGLAFVREIAMDHGGRVEVDSADGETTFTIVLPA
jgi:signal transduction histidine kinase